MQRAEFTKIMVDVKKKQKVFMTWQCQDEYEVTAHNYECLDSQQEREGIEL